MSENKYVNFVLTESRANTKVYSIVSRSSYDILGEVKWYAPWRQYCFTPTEEFGTVWSRGCLNEISLFLASLMEARRK